MCCSVIGPALACCGDLDLPGFRLGHRQLAARIAYIVVACFTLREFMARHFVLYRTLAHILDASFNRCTDAVVTDKAFHVIFRPALGFSGICERFVLCGDRHGLRGHFQLAILWRHCVVLCDIFLTVHDLIGYDFVRYFAFSHVGHAAFYNSCQLMALHQYIFCISVAIISKWCAIVNFCIICGYQCQRFWIDFYVRFFINTFCSVGNFYIYRISTIILFGYIGIFRNCVTEVFTID